MTLAFSLNIKALAQDFGSTGSSLMNTGSNYTSTVYGVGAANVDAMYGTTANGPLRRTTGSGSSSSDWDDDTEVNPGDPLPLGAPYILLLFAAGAAGVVALRRRRSANS